LNVHKNISHEEKSPTNIDSNKVKNEKSISEVSDLVSKIIKNINGDSNKK
jgi:hypothetical protein